jgi:molybdate transport system substrate-binding protein
VPKLLVLAAVAMLAFGACGGDDDSSGSPAGNTTAANAEALEGSLSVFAASSLTEAFTTLGERFETENPDVDVVANLNFAASSDLVTQITEGAPADVFASADESNMQKILDAGQNDGEPVVFAHNQLAIAVEPGNPLDISSLADLAKPDVKLVLCAETVPCGKLADEALQKAGVTVSPVSREANVKDTLGKVGEADAAIVYVTDVRSSEAVEGVEIPEADNVMATLPMVGLKGASDTALAAAWVSFVTSPAGQQVLKTFGFLPA